MAKQSDKKKTKGRADGLKEIKVEIGKKLDGTPIRKSFYGHTKGEAGEKAREYIKKRQFGEIDEKITLADWADKWLEVYKGGNIKDITYEFTYKSPIENHIKPYFKDARIAAIKPIDIQDFFNTKKDLSESALHKIKIILKALFDTAIENDLLIKNPLTKNTTVKSSKTPVEKRAYTKDEVADIIKFAMTHKYGVPIITMLKAGLRPSEIVVFKRSNVDFKNDTYAVTHSATRVKGVFRIEQPKNKASMKATPIDKDLKAILAAQVPNINDFFFVGENGKPMWPDKWAKSQYKEFMKDYMAFNPEARILEPDELRHTFGSQVYESTKDIYMTMRLMRHSKVETTIKHYVHEEMDTKKKALAKVAKRAKK